MSYDPLLFPKNELWPLKMCSDPSYTLFMTAPLYDVIILSGGLSIMCTKLFRIISQSNFVAKLLYIIVLYFKEIWVLFAAMLLFQTCKAFYPIIYVRYFPRHVINKLF